MNKVYLLYRQYHNFFDQSTRELVDPFASKELAEKAFDDLIQSWKDNQVEWEVTYDTGWQVENQKETSRLIAIHFGVEPDGENMWNKFIIEVRDIRTE